MRGMEDRSNPGSLLDIPADARSPAINDLFFNLNQKWQLPFWLMLSLSAGIAALGLSEDSAATIIGAMIVAPLGQPIIALGASITLGWPREAVKMLVLIFLGAFTVLMISFLLGILLPHATPNRQILLRTAPDLRDLGIAVFAGIAGTFGSYRKEYSAVLAGVAIAVALIPPLCAAGLMAEEGRFILATGGLLLFLTNFIGITLAAILTLFLAGLHGGLHRRWFFAGTIATVAAIIVILTPLTLNFHRITGAVQFEKKVYESALRILQGIPGTPAITGLTVDGAELAITLKPLPPDAVDRQRLVDALQRATGLQVSLRSTDSLP
jgi:uncharacterized hydrophobic protein (TIGR00271 family)